MGPYDLKNSQLRLAVKAKPNARSTGIKEITDTEIVINVNASPVDNKANKELVGFISKAFGVSKTHVKIVCGSSSTSKVIIIDLWNGSVEDVQRILGGG